MDAAFAPVVAAAGARITETFGAARRHSAYLYGSIPRGTARPGLSDFDLLLALHQEPTAADRAEARALEAALDESFPQVNGVSVLLFSTGTLLSELERHDLGFMVACRCTPADRSRPGPGPAVLAGSGHRRRPAGAEPGHRAAAGPHRIHAGHAALGRLDQ